MADDENAARIVSQKVFEPLRHLDIEVVCRLIKKKEVRLAQQRFCQADACLLSA